MDSTEPETFRYTRKQALIYGILVAVGSLALSILVSSTLTDVLHHTFTLATSLGFGFAAGWMLRYIRLNTDWNAGIPERLHGRGDCAWDYPTCSGFNLGSADDPGCVGKRVWMIRAGLEDDLDDDDDDWPYGQPSGGSEWRP